MRQGPASRAAYVRYGTGSDHLGDRAGDVVDVLAVQRRYADAAGLDAVDAEFAAQALHLLLGQARVAEHTLLASDEAQVLLNAGGLELLDQGSAHRLDANAHASEFLFPHRAQR